MKIVWIINKPFPAISKKIGTVPVLSMGWLLDIAYGLSKDTENELITISADLVSKEQVITDDRIKHYIVPVEGRFGKGRSYKKYLKGIVEYEQPDIVHLFGTETNIGLEFLRLYPESNAILTIQGIMDRISDEYLGGLDKWTVITNRTLRENLRFGGMLFAYIKSKQQKKNERRILNSVKFVTGRTLWDYSVMKRINPSIHYYKCNFNLRNEFYGAKKWSLDAIQRHSIYTGFSEYPLKGLHILLEAVALVKQSYPDVVLFVPGVEGDANQRIIANTGYKKLIRKIIREYELTENVKFLGGQKACEVVSRMLKSHVTVVSSAIEGASATICESMYLGVPCICTFRGGMTELIKDGETGFYYDYPEYSFLAERIKQIFADDNLALKFSVGLIKDAEIRHDREKNVESYISMYNEIGGAKTC